MMEQEKDTGEEIAPNRTAVEKSLASSSSAPQLPVDTRPHLGPFYVGVISSALGAALLLALACGMPMTMTTVLMIIVPGMTTATTLLAVAMGWVFIMLGRTKRKPRWLPGVGVMIAITMLEMFALTYISSLAKA